MYLSIATTHRPATDIGFLLHKNPARLHEVELPFGRALVFYPQASEERCEAALVLDIDPVGLVRGRGRGDGLLDHYVNDRPYAASSFLSVALARTFGTAMAGSSRDRPELAASAIPLEAAVTPVRGSERLISALFEPLGWTVGIDPIEGAGERYSTLRLAGMAPLQTLLNHLYVLIPVLDDDKHYWIGEDEVAKLLRRGKGWLETHPEREAIVRRYLAHRRGLAREALERLAPEARNEADVSAARVAPEDALEVPLRLNDERLASVIDALRSAGARTVADLGCGEGRLLGRLVVERWVESLVGVDASSRDLDRAARRLKLDQPGRVPEGRVRLLHGSLTYRDKRWEGVDAACLVEVIEHLDRDRLDVLQRVVFGAARPATIIVTTPNVEYNALFPNLPRGSFRHPDHRFEWTRAEFRDWAGRIAASHGYRVSFAGIGRADENLGTPTQMAMFST